MMPSSKAIKKDTDLQNDEGEKNMRKSVIAAVITVIIAAAGAVIYKKNYK